MPVRDKPSERATEREKLKDLEWKFATELLNLVVLSFEEIGKDKLDDALMGDAVNTELEVVLRVRGEQGSCTNAIISLSSGAV